jgi:hypothetical protein
MSKAKTKSTKPKAAKPAKVAKGKGDPLGMEAGLKDIQSTTKPKAAKAEAPAKVALEQRNGITRPGAATICGKVWAFLDANKGATAAAVIEGIKDINPATARTQAQRYKQFNA